MKIVFVNPPVTKEERYGTLAPAGSYAPPLGLFSLAAVTRKMGYETMIIDSQAQRLTHKETLRYMESISPEIVGITSTTSTFLSAAELSGMIKGCMRDSIVMAGGVHVSALPEESLQKFKDIDIAVVGEAEETIIELLAAIKDKKSLKDVKGIAFSENGKIVITESRPLIKNLDALPLPAWDLQPSFPEDYNVQAQSVANSPSTSLCTSRGCSGKCTFCDRRIFGSSLRAHSAEYVMEMIKDLYYNYGIRDIQFEDDNFMLFRKRLLGICDMLKQERLDLSWSCQARVDTVNLETLKTMKEAGCWSVLYGVESGSQKILNLMKKRIKLESIEKAVDMAHKAGLFCKAFFITGFIGETKETLKESRDFLKKAKFDDISNHYYVPFPGSESYSTAAEYGSFEKDWRKMNYYEVVFIPDGLSKDDLIRHSKQVYRQFYLKPRIVINYLRRIKDLKHFLYLLQSGLALIKYVFQKKDT